LKYSTQILFLLLSFFSTYIIAQELPPIKNYTPKTYGGENQNWAISQSKSKYIYVANNKGLLEFNGSEWSVHPSPDNSIIRSVANIDSLIYTGSYMEFGFWKKNKIGELKYQSLSKDIKNTMLEDEQIWNIVKLKQWILFQSLNRIYIYDTNEKSFNVINSKTVLQKIHKINGSIYFQKMDDGLYQIINGSEVLVTNDPIIKDNIIVNIHNINGQTVLLTQEKGFFVLTNNKINKWKTSSNTIFPKVSIYSSITTKNNNIILGTISNGIFLLDNKGEIIENITQSKGLNNNTVLSIFEDIDNNIWLGLDNGISVMNLNSPFKAYSDLKGKLGTIYASAYYKDKLYLGTNQGLFHKKEFNDLAFQPIEGTEGQVWTLKVIDNTLFCGHNSGTFIINDTIAKKIATAPGTWDFKSTPNQPNMVIQGNYNGLYVLEKVNGLWKLRNKIKGFESSSRFFEIIDGNKVLVNHEYKGIFTLKINSDFTEIQNIELNKKFNATRSSIVKHKDAILLCNKGGIYNYNQEFNSFSKDSIYTKDLFTNENFVSGKLISIENKLWAFTDKSIVYFSSGQLDNKPTMTKISFPTTFREDFTSFENLSHINENQYLLGNSNGYLTIDTDKIKKKNHNISINRINTENRETIKRSVSINDSNIFKFTENNIEFSYSIPVYEKFTEINYQYKLVGIYDNWSNWATKSKTSFKNLPFGEYTFIVRGKVGNNNTKNQNSYSFTIERPWYLSNNFIGLYLFILIILFILIHNVYNQYYKKQKKNLIEKNQRKLERSQLESEKEIMKLRNDKLRHDIESKNRELAASTMSIIKKNEFLNTVKKELLEVKNNELIKPVIKIIDKNLNHTSDWELFQEAFNNADKDFLKKVKERHPSLTPNDLRLCAYLRLNLSSKEIAPLLNISHKSVEIKRYRLRKKMNLESKDNLIHHILDI
jgi:DNA-binding CsgD family transcriptional regulator